MSTFIHTAKRGFHDFLWTGLRRLMKARFRICSSLIITPFYRNILSAGIQWQGVVVLWFEFASMNSSAQPGQCRSWGIPPLRYWEAPKYRPVNDLKYLLIFLKLRISECHFHPSNPRRPCLIPTRRSAKNWTAVPQCWVWWLVWLSKPWQARGFLNRSGPLTGPLCWIFLRWQHWYQEFSVDVTTLGQEVDLKWPAKQEWENNWKKQIKILVA